MNARPDGIGLNGPLVGSNKSLIFSMDTDNCVAPPIPFVYCFCLQNLRRHMCCRAIKTKLIGVAASDYQCLYLCFSSNVTLFAGPMQSSKFGSNRRIWSGKFFYRKKEVKNFNSVWFKFLRYQQKTFLRFQIWGTFDEDENYL